MPAGPLEGFEVLLTCPNFSLGFSFGRDTPAQAGTNRMTYLFEDYSLDTDRRELRRGTDLIGVEPQVFDLLLFLIRNRTRVVSRDDLIAEVWSGRIVSESALYSRITAARRAIGDSGEAQRLIRTVARKGLRFVADVREAHASELNSLVSRQPPPHAIVPEQSAAPTQARPAISRDGRQPAVVVMPFDNLSRPSDDYLVDGLVEEITSALSRVRDFCVIARQSAFAYKGRLVDAREVNNTLGARYVVEGTVRRDGDRLRALSHPDGRRDGGRRRQRDHAAEVDLVRAQARRRPAQSRSRLTLAFPPTLAKIPV